MTSPFIALPVKYFVSDVVVRAEHVSYIEVIRAQSGSKIVIGLHGGGTLDSFVFQPDDATLSSLRQMRDQIMNELAEKLAPTSEAPSWRALPAVGE